MSQTDQNVDHGLWIRSVRNPHRQAEPTVAVGERPVDELAREQLSIGDDDLRSVKGAHGARADTDLLHSTLESVDLDQIADPHRPLEDQDQTRDKILDQILQPKPDPHTQGSRQQRHPAEIDTRRRQCKEETDAEDQIVDQHRDGGRDAPVEACARIDILLEEKAHKPGDHHRRKDDQDKSETSPREMDRVPRVQCQSRTALNHSWTGARSWNSSRVPSIHRYRVKR